MFTFTKLHYEKNWFASLFSVMKKVVLDGTSGQPLLSFRQTWKNDLLVFDDPLFSSLRMEARFLRGSVLTWKWDVRKAGSEKPLAQMQSSIAQTALAFGVEVLNFFDESGAPVMSLTREEGSVLKHVVDNMIDLYNPTHVYVLKTTAGKDVAQIAAKHGILKNIYDLEILGGTEKEKELALMAFAFLLIMLKK